jgi:predicted RNA binding protein YcfA (HicA-like mRNA interferase family)
MSGRQEMTQLVRSLARQGWLIEKTRGNHWRARHPDRAGIAFFPSTPSDHRSILNTQAQLRRMPEVAL